MPTMRDVWHGQVIDRVFSADMCRLDVWVFERDRAVLIATAPGKVPEIGSLVVGEALGTDEVQLRTLTTSEWPPDFRPIVPVDRGAARALPVMKLDMRRFEAGDEVAGTTGRDRDVDIFGGM